MGEVLKRADRAARAIRERAGFVPRTAVVLGSGLGGFGDSLKDPVVIDYRDLPDFPVSAVPGHRGRFLFGHVGGEPVALMQGRVHWYEGWSMEDVVLPLRALRLLGAERAILTNAAGGVGDHLSPGDLMLLTDHIATFVPSPLRGPNEDHLGPRFPDMTEVYSPRLRELAKRAAQELSIDLKEGVYLQAPGPQYETPAEVRMFRLLGADAVGMSTACEAVAARHMGMEVCGLSCITNLAAGLQGRPLTHEEVKATAARAAGDFQRLLTRLLKTMG